VYQVGQFLTSWGGQLLSSSGGHFLTTFLFSQKWLFRRYWEIAG
jgi:hypothetical protein